MALIVILWLMDIRTVFEPPFLLPMLNIIFSSVIPFVMAYISARSFLIENGSVSVLFLSCGMFALGLGGGVSGWFYAVYGILSTNIIIYNSSAFFCSFFHLSGAMLYFSFPEWNPEGNRSRLITLSYLLISVILGFVYYAAICNHLPVFFQQGSGQTIVGKAVLGVSILMFGISSFIFSVIYMSGRQKLILIYSIGLGMIAVGLTAVLIQKSAGSPLGWAGRCAQYAGIIYILSGVVSFYKMTRRKDFPFEAALASIFTEARANYKALIDSAGDAIILTDYSGRVMIWNNAAEKLFGYTVTEATGSLLNGMIFNELIPGDYVTDLTGVVLRDLYGRVFPADITVSRRKSSTGIITTYIIKDVTDRKIAEDALRESESLYRTLFENMLNGFAFCEMHFDENEQPSDFTYLVVNDAFEKLTGLKNVTGRKGTEVIPGIMENDYALLELYGRVSKTGKTEQREIFIESLKQWYWLSVYCPRSGFLAMVFDVITDRKLAAALKESERRYRHLVENSPDIVYTFSSMRGCIYYSPRAEQVLGYSLEYLYAHPFIWNESIHPDDRELVGNAIEEFKNGKSFNIEYRIKNATGNWLWIQDRSIGRVTADDEELIEGMATDITERKHSEIVIKNLLAEKELVLKEVHHRIKNNMNTIKNLLLLQAGEINDPLAAEALKDTSSRVLSMMVLYDKLYRSDNYGMVSFMDYLSTLIDDITANFTDNKTLKIIKNFDNFLIDVKKLQPMGIIINELLTNIMKYAFTGIDERIIDISAILSGSHVTIILKDNGIGIPESVEFGHSKGFGFMLMEILVKQLKGSIRFERGDGTKFIIEFDK